MNTPSRPERRVSIIIPVYDTAPFVAEALDSVFGQTFGDYEIIVVNDGSPDSNLLEKVLEPYRERITYIVQQNRGVAGARNTGLKASRAKYVAMLDSDDRWHPEYLASQLSILETAPSVDVVYPDAVRFAAGTTGTTRYSDAYPAGGEISFLRVLARKCQIYGGVTARRETLLRVGLYDEVLRSGEDLDLWLRILKAGGRIVYNDHVLAYYRIREGTLTSGEVPLGRNILKLLDKLETKMELTVEERAALDHQRAVIVAKLGLAEAKQAFIQGDTKTAVATLTAAARYAKSWKLLTVIAMLKLAPGLLRQLWRLREWSGGKVWNSRMSLRDQP